MKKKIIAVILAVFFATGSIFVVHAKEATIIDNSKELFRQIQLLADSITLISTDYFKPVKVKDLVYGAIKGMMGTLDGYSQFLDPESFKEITEETKGEFGGLGIEIGIRNGILTVISPIEDTPAFKAGLQPDDKIIKIEGEITQDMTLDDAVKKLRGKPGTKVTITIIREDIEKLLDFTITRAIIKLKSIKKAKVIEDDIGYVKLVEFQERTSKDLEKAVMELEKNGAKSLIIDVRNNPGGLLDSSVYVAELFLEPGKMVVYTEGRTPEKRIEFKTKRRSIFGKLNLIVLVNKGTASAAEILAGAIKDNKRGLVVGVPTFGKGSVQTVIPLKDKSALRLTTASYYTPSGECINEKGIKPDVYVKRERIEGEKKKPDKKEEEGVFQKLEKKGKIPKPEKKKEEKKKEAYDNQLQTAISILKGLQIYEGYKSGGEEGEGKKQETI
ncbi:MAG: S41 family peptidase [Candidatus Omnitrophota bacterium]